MTAKYFESVGRQAKSLGRMPMRHVPHLYNLPKWAIDAVYSGWRYQQFAPERMSSSGQRI